MTPVIGHGAILEFFAKVIENNNLSHAYCFVGPDGVGKKTVAKQIAAKLFGVNVEKLLSQIDFIVVEQQFDEKKGKTKRDISVEQMRDLREFLSRRSYLGGYKIAIIDEAEKMNLEAANALLKTLEEPKEKVILFLITKDEAELPETILSRCQKIYFQPVLKSDLENYLLTKKIDKKEAELMLKLSAGLPGKIINWLEDEESYCLYKKEIQRFDSLLEKPFFEKLKIVEDLFGDKTDAVATRENLQNVLDIWWQGVLKNFKDNLWGREKTLEIENSIQEARNLLDKNIHPRLLVENILLKIK